MSGTDDRLAVSVVVATYNRCELLPQAIQSLLAQDSNGLEYEVIVVDNNSTDKTRDVVNSFSDSDHRVRYVFEGRQGNSYARNAGINESRSSIVAFIDDDIRADRDWIGTIKSTFDEHPEIGFIGGKVLPIWTVEPPHWLTSRHWMPLGLQDHGDEEFYLEPARVTGVISANLAVRRDLLEQVGMFSPKFQLVRGSIGGMEDHELVNQMWREGAIGMYVPQLRVETPVDRDRMRKRYHRRWHKSHGQNYALMREERMEKASWHLFGVPAHLYRQAILDVVGLITNWIRQREEAAFLCEGHLWFFFGFLWQRARDLSKAT